MKIMHIADLHIGKRVNGFSMTEDQKYILDEIKKIAEEKEISVMCISGDVYDKVQPSEEAVRIFDRFITDISNHGIKILMISGNHDSADRLAFGADLFEKSNIYISRRPEKTIKKIQLEDEYGKINFYLLPFVRPIDVRSMYTEENIADYNSALKKLIDTNKPDISERNIMLAHQFVTGAFLSDSEELTVGAVENVEVGLFSDFDYTALGHIHRPQSIKKNVAYSGSPLKYSFSEISYNKSVPIIDIKEKGNMDIEKIPLKPLRDMREIKGKYDDLMSLENYIGTNTDDYIHVILTDEEKVVDAIKKMRNVYPNIMKLDYENTRTKNLDEVVINDSIGKIDPEQIIKEFYFKEFKIAMNEQQIEYAKKKIEEVWG